LLKKFCVLGNPIKHSKSPDIFKYFFNDLNIKAQYEACFINNNASFKEFILQTKNVYSGYNVTAPFKDFAFNMMDEVHSSASSLESINCINIVDNKLVGYNTDYYGFEMLLKCLNSINLTNKHFLVLGNGSTARTVSLALYNLFNKTIYLFGRNINNVNNFIELMNQRITFSNAIVPYKANSKAEYILINCLPINITDKDVNFIFNNILLENIEFLIDVNYVDNNLSNSLKDKNIQIVKGYDMLLFQALKNLDIWFDKKYSTKIDINKLRNNIFNNE